MLFKIPNVAPVAPQWRLTTFFNIAIFVFVIICLAVSFLLEGRSLLLVFPAWLAALSLPLFFTIWHVRFHGVIFLGSSWYGFRYAPLSDVIDSAGHITGLPLWVLVNLFFLFCRLPLMPVYFIFVRFFRLFEGREDRRGDLLHGGMVALAGTFIHAAIWATAAWAVLR